MEKSEQISNDRNVRPGQGKPVAQPGTLSLSLFLEIGKGHGVSAFCSIGTKDAPQSSFETETHPVFLKQISVSTPANRAVWLSERRGRDVCWEPLSFAFLIASVQSHQSHLSTAR